MINLAIFLRGVNVNGITIKMTVLKQVFESLGYSNVCTYLASGNVTCTWNHSFEVGSSVGGDAGVDTVVDASVDAREAAAELAWHKHHLETSLSQHFNYEAYVVLKTQEDVKAILMEAHNHKVPEGYHHYVLLSSSMAGAEDLERVARQELALDFDRCTKAEFEALIVGQRSIYWIVPKGDTLKSEFGKKVLGSKKYKSLLTSRTMGTLEKMVAR